MGYVTIFLSFGTDLQTKTKNASILTTAMIASREILYRLLERKNLVTLFNFATGQ